MQQAILYIKHQLSPIYPENEISSFIKLIFFHLYGYSPTDIIMYKNNILLDSKPKELQEIVDRLKKEEPIQYILGKTEFMGLTFSVAPGVLIPRPETEELVDLILKEHPDKPSTKIIDIGTGSGCIAISLAKYRPHSSVEAWDISSEALKQASANAKQNSIENIIFKQTDILAPDKNLIPDCCDIIVSNPPYVCTSEKKEIKNNVLNHEPHSALFVPDTDPLLFYREIAKKALLLLKSDGFLYFEINSRFGQETAHLLNTLHFRNIRLIKDISGKDRIISATKQ